MFCLLLSSCAKQRQSYSHESNIDESLINNNRNVILDTVIQQEAMLVDIPIPLYDERIISSFSYPCTLDTQVFGYKSPLSRAQATEFFMSQMERYGWRHLVSFEGEELLLQFESPDRYCTVVIKNSMELLSGSCIFIYIKRASSESSLISSELG